MSNTPLLLNCSPDFMSAFHAGVISHQRRASKSPMPCHQRVCHKGDMPPIKRGRSGYAPRLFDAAPAALAKAAGISHGQRIHASTAPPTTALDPFPGQRLEFLPRPRAVVVVVPRQTRVLVGAKQHERFPSPGIQDARRRGRHEAQEPRPAGRRVRSWRPLASSYRLGPPPPLSRADPCLGRRKQGTEASSPPGARRHSTSP